MQDDTAGDGDNPVFRWTPHAIWWHASSAARC